MLSFIFFISSSSFPSPLFLLLLWCYPCCLLSGLQTRRFPTCNPYMVDPFSLSGNVQEQPIYCNTSVLEHMVRTTTFTLHAELTKMIR